MVMQPKSKLQVAMVSRATLTVDLTKLVEWKATSKLGRQMPGPFTWKFEKRTSGTASPGYQWSKTFVFLYLSSPKQLKA